METSIPKNDAFELWDSKIPSLEVQTPLVLYFMFLPLCLFLVLELYVCKKAKNKADD